MGWLRNLLRRQMYVGRWDMFNPEMLDEASGQRAMEIGYRQTWNVYVCVDKIAKSGADLPVKMVQKQGDKLIEVESNPVLDLFRGTANPEQSGIDFLREYNSHLNINGNAYAYVPTLAGEPVAMWPLKSHRVEAITSDDPMSPISRYDYHLGSGKVVKYKPEEIWHTKLFNPDSNIKGLSPIAVARRIIETQNLSEAWNNSLLKRGARPFLKFFTDKMLTDQQYKRLRKDTTEAYSGAMNAGRSLILEGGVKADQFQLSPADMDWLNSSKMTLRKIATVFGVPPEMVGDAEQKTYSNYKEARDSFYFDTVIPMSSMILRSASRYFFTGNDFRLMLDREKIEVITRALRERTAALKDSWWWSANERRKEQGKEPLDTKGMDDILVPAGFVPIDMLALGPTGDM